MSPGRVLRGRYPAGEVIGRGDARLNTLDEAAPVAGAVGSHTATVGLDR